MLYRIKTIGGTKKKVPLAGSTPAGLPVGSILSTYKKIQPYNYLYCDGSTFDETQYPELYLYLGTNVLPDYRECVQVGAEKNTTDIFDSTETDPSTGLPGTQSHDVFAQGEFKDDQIQGHFHFPVGLKGNVYGGMVPVSVATTGTVGVQMTSDGGSTSSIYAKNVVSDDMNGTPRTGTTTRTKEKAVYYYIKAVDGVDIADEDTFLNTVVNTIQDAQSYSTTEEKTGGKWIDGKDIYRKVKVVNATYPNSIDFGLSSGDEIIDYKIKASWGDSMAISVIGESSDFGSSRMPMYVIASDKKTLIQTTSSGNVYIYWVVVEYTKNE